jgi:hypothetical protein
MLVEKEHFNQQTIAYYKRWLYNHPTYQTNQSPVKSLLPLCKAQPLIIFFCPE